MSRIPEPDQTPDGPAYEGRLLDRPDEEVVDQGVSFDIRTLISRRGVLSLVGVGVGAATLAACSATASSSSSSTPSTSTSTGTATATPTPAETTVTVATPEGEIPDETAGPYPGDGSNGPDILEQSGVVRSDIRSSIDGGATAEGVALTFTLSIVDMANGNIPFENAAVYAWHCDAAGLYSMYSDEIVDETYLRGVQVADANGQVTFTSIFPGCYSGRWPHIHFEVYPDVDSITDSTNAIATSQLAFPQDVCDTVYALDGYDGSAQNLSQLTLESDNIFSDDTEGLQMAAVSGDVSTGYIASLVVGVDTTTEPTSSGMGGGPGGGAP